MRHDEEWAAECAENEEVEQKERLDIFCGFHEQVHEETSLAEDAQKVEYLDPHEETGNSLHRDAEFCDVWEEHIDDDY